jgi:hypothetical protein
MEVEAPLRSRLEANGLDRPGADRLSSQPQMDHAIGEAQGDEDGLSLELDFARERARNGLADGTHLGVIVSLPGRLEELIWVSWPSTAGHNPPDVRW